jgi:hypothetical protein
MWVHKNLVQFWSGCLRACSKPPWQRIDMWVKHSTGPDNFLKVLQNQKQSFSLQNCLTLFFGIIFVFALVWWGQSSHKDKIRVIGAKIFFCFSNYSAACWPGEIFALNEFLGLHKIKGCGARMVTLRTKFHNSIHCPPVSRLVHSSGTDEKQTTSIYLTSTSAVGECAQQSVSKSAGRTNLMLK